MNPQRILTMLVALACVLPTMGCASSAARTESEPAHSSPLSVLDSSESQSLIGACADSAWPEEYEVRTIQIQRAVGLFYIAPDTDVDSEMERMNAKFVDDGALREALAEQ